jgi:integrase
MFVFPRGNVWWYEIPNPDGGKPIRESTKVKGASIGLNKGAAEALMQSEAAKLKFIGKSDDRAQPLNVKTVNDALKRWYLEIKGSSSLREEAKRTISDDLQRGAFWERELGNVPLKLVTTKKIDEAVARLRSGKKLKNGTCNRYISLIAAVLNACERKWHWLDKAPRVNKLPENNTRDVYLTDEEIPQIARLLPEVDADMLVFGTNTGLRLGNIYKMRWEWLNLSRKRATIPASSYKNSKPHTIPLNERVMEILQKYKGRHEEFVFANAKGKPAKRYNQRRWYEARTAIGKPTLRWHEATRHTFATHLAERGTPMIILQQLGGWRSSEMLTRYAHLNADATAQWISKPIG